MRARLRAAIEAYLGHAVDSVRVYRDPISPDWWAARAVRDGEVFDFVANAEDDDLADGLEETEFDSWPPKADPKNVGLL